MLRWLANGLEQGAGAAVAREATRGFGAIWEELQSVDAAKAAGVRRAVAGEVAPVGVQAGDAKLERGRKRLWEEMERWRWARSRSGSCR